MQKGAIHACFYSGPNDDKLDRFMGDMLQSNKD